MVRKCCIDGFFSECFVCLKKAIHADCSLDSVAFWTYEHMRSYVAMFMQLCVCWLIHSCVLFLLSMHEVIKVLPFFMSYYVLNKKI